MHPRLEEALLVLPGDWENVLLVPLPVLLHQSLVQPLDLAFKFGGSGGEVLQLALDTAQDQQKQECRKEIHS